jgi:endoglucanase
LLPTQGVVSLSVVRRLLLALLAVSLPLIFSATGQAEAAGFHLHSTQLYVAENAGQAVISVERSPADAAVAAQVRYITVGLTAVAHFDYLPVKAELEFAAGETSKTFTVPIIDHGVDSLPKTIKVSLFGAHSTPMGNPSSGVLTILNQDPPVLHNVLNPLGLLAPPTGSNPLAGATFFVDHQSVVARAARRYPGLRVIASEPGALRFGTFSGPDVGIAVTHYLTRAAVQEPGTVPMIATYRIVDGDCKTRGDSAADAASYHNFIERFAAGIGDYRAVLFLEMDSVITTPCLSRHGLAVRIQELSDAIDVLTANCPRLVIYLDAGAADALRARDAARVLNRAGIAKIQGFFLNSTHFDWTSREIRYGEAVSRMTGGKHFVINTGENGRGPLAPPNIVQDGNEVLCNPPGRGLGPKPTTHTGYANVDAFAWMSNPGESGGLCGTGAPPTGGYWPAYGLTLVRNADFHVR